MAAADQLCYALLMLAAARHRIGEQCIHSEAADLIGGSSGLCLPFPKDTRHGK